MNHRPQSYLIWDKVLPVAITSSTDATPIVITATAHGLVTGDQVMIFGHATNIAANGMYSVTKVTANTFSLQNINTGASVAGSGAGAGSGGFMVKAPKVLFTEGFKSIQFELHTSGSAAFTLQFANSFGRKVQANASDSNDSINFGAVISADNPYAFMNIIDLQSGSPIDGGTGVVAAGTDIDHMYELNINGAKIVCPFLSAWSSGTITLKVHLLHFGN